MKKMNKRQTLEWIRDKILGGHLDEDISRGDIVNAIDEALERHDINLWGYYKKQITWTNPLDTFSLDSIEFHENIRWTLEKLKNEKPTPGTSHDWNAAISALEMYMPEFTKAYKKFRKRMTEKNAQAFSDAFDEINPALQMAKNAMFNSMLRKHWNEVQDDLRAKE